MKRILVINLGWEQEPLLDKLSEYEVEIYGVHYNKNYYKKPKYKDVLITDIRDLESIIDFAHIIKPDAVISDECDYSQFAQSIIADKFNLAGPKIKNAQLSSNKYLQRTEAKKKAVLIPEFKLCTSIEDVKEFVREYGYPLIIKPVDNRGSFGVNRINNNDDIENAFYDSLINSHSRLVIIERFIEGTHITVDGYKFKNNDVRALAVATKGKLKEKGYIIDEEITYPANLTEVMYKKALKNAEFVARSLGFDFGFIHGEFIIDEEDNIYLTEMANRGGGVYTSEIILPYYTGIDILDFYIKDCLNIDYKFDENIVVLNNPVLMKFFQFSDNKEGVVKNISGIDLLLKSNNVLKVNLFIKKGDYLRKIKNGADRHGMIIVSSNDKKELNNTLDKLIKQLRVEIE